MGNFHPSDWYASRKSGIGASEVAALFGFARFGKTAVSVWASKQPGHQPEPEQEHQLMGHWLEPACLKLLAHREGIRADAAPGRYLCAAAPWLFASPDGITPDAVVECKTARDYTEWGESGTDNIPTDYMIQCQTQMLCTGRQLCWLVVFFSLFDQRIYRIEAHAAMQARIIEHTGKVWSDWQSGIRPEPQNSDDCRRLWPFLTDETINLDTTHDAGHPVLQAVWALDGLASDQAAIKAEKAAIRDRENEVKQQAEALKTAIAKTMGNARTLNIDGQPAYRRVQTARMNTPTIQRVRNADAYSTEQPA